jgi:aminomethyltransferase
MTDPAPLRRTPLYASHVALGGKIVPFAGWEMPVKYTAGDLEEHKAVRERVGVFDVSHMGQFEFRGPKAVAAANHLVTNDIAKLEVGRAAYAGLLNEKGGFIDDVFVYKVAPEHLIMVVNAANVAKDWAWVDAHTPRGVVQNRSDSYALIAVQGPKAIDVVQPLVNATLSTMVKNSIVAAEVCGKKAFVARSGYTGEDGFELFLNPADATRVWDAVLEKGKPFGILPAGLGCRDSLRTEVKNALYGNDIDDDHTPLEAGLGWIVKLDKGDFIGKAPLEAQKAAGITRKLVGFVTEKRIPRHGYPILKDGVRIGEVTSGTMGPTLKKPIGMGYVPVALAVEGATFDVEIFGRPEKATVVKTPFYKRPA